VKALRSTLGKTDELGLRIDRCVVGGRGAGSERPADHCFTISIINHGGTLDALPLPGRMDQIGELSLWACLKDLVRGGLI